MGAIPFRHFFKKIKPFKNMSKPTYIKKEDVSTDNIYKYDFDYETGEFSGYWLKFKYVDVSMDTRDPFDPVQDNNAYAVYDCYLFDTDDISSIAKAYSVDYYYVDKDTYNDLVNTGDSRLKSYSILPYEITNGTMTVNKFYIPDNFNIEDYKPDEPVGTEYVTPHLMESEGVEDINNFDVGYQLSLNANINSPVINAIEFTGHAELGSTPNDPSDIDVTYFMGTPFGCKFDENGHVDYYGLYYIKNAEGNPTMQVYLSDGNSNNIECIYTIPGDVLPDFNIEEDHTYKMALEIDSTDVKSTGNLHVVPSLYIDGNRLSTTDVGTLDFDISRGTRDFENWLNDFKTHIYLFGCKQGDNWGEFIVTAMPFEISNVIIYYTSDGDISQLNPGSTQGSWSLDATSYNVLNDGTQDYQLTPMSQLITGDQEEPSE